MPTCPPIPHLALTPGEPAGIGYDLCAQISAQVPTLGARLMLIADPDVLADRARSLGIPCPFYTMHDPHDWGDPKQLHLLPVKAPHAVSAGHLDARNSPFVMQCLDWAVDLCQHAHIQAMVTGPVHKGIINEGGIPFSGHTEYLEQRCGTKAVMLLATPGLRVALLTTHVPLAQVPALVTAARLEEVIVILDRELRQRMGISHPRIRVCGLNPHAGEQGHLGREEIDVMIPTIEKLRKLGLRIEGPVPADTAFLPDQLSGCDVVLTLYHDQGLPVLKHLGFSDAVNISLGLPFIRTSVDHGTALELAGTGKTNPGSLLAAIQSALAMLAHDRPD